MTYSDQDADRGDFSGGAPGGETPWNSNFTDEQLDQLLGEDADPNLSVEAKRAIVGRIRAAEDAALDRLLALDGTGLEGVEIPGGLADRVMESLDLQRGSHASELLVPAAPNPSIPARRRLYLVGGAFAAAAAAAILLVALKKGPATEVAPDITPQGGRGSAAELADTDIGSDLIPSDEFLALLPTLENVDFLTDELDPLEADALFLFETEDELLLDLLDENG